MAERIKSKGGKKGRKYGRKKDRSPSHKRYVAINQRDINKKRKAQRYANKFGCDVKIKYKGEIITISSQNKKIK